MAVKTEIGKTRKAEELDQTRSKQGPRKRVCLFCEADKEPTLTDSSQLRKFMSDRARIIPRAKSGVCSKHQRRLALEIKYARHLALLPFVNRV